LIVTICTVQLWKSDDDDDTSTSGPKYGNVRGSYNEGTVTSSMALARPFRVWTGSNKRDISGSGHGIFRVRIFTVPCLTRFFPFFYRLHTFVVVPHLSCAPFYPISFPVMLFFRPSIVLLPYGGRVQLISLRVCHLQGSKTNNRPRYAQCYLSNIPNVRILLEYKQTVLTYIGFL